MFWLEQIELSDDAFEKSNSKSEARNKFEWLKTLTIPKRDLGLVDLFRISLFGFRILFRERARAGGSGDQMTIVSGR